MSVYRVLYTHQKTKKSKVWQDGLLRQVGATKCTLHTDPGGRFLESVFVGADRVAVGEEIESDSHLIMIEELDKGDKENAGPSAPASVTTAVASHPPPPPRVKPVFSSSSTKFRPPLLRTGAAATDVGREEGVLASRTVTRTPQGISSALFQRSQNQWNQPPASPQFITNSTPVTTTQPNISSIEGGGRRDGREQVASLSARGRTLWGNDGPSSGPGAQFGLITRREKEPSTGPHSHTPAEYSSTPQISQPSEWSPTQGNVLSSQFTQRGSTRLRSTVADSARKSYAGSTQLDATQHCRSLDSILQVLEASEPQEEVVEEVVVEEEVVIEEKKEEMGEEDIEAKVMISAQPYPRSTANGRSISSEPGPSCRQVSDWSSINKLKSSSTSAKVHPDAVRDSLSAPDCAPDWAQGSAMDLTMDEATATRFDTMAEQCYSSKETRQNEVDTILSDGDFESSFDLSIDGFDTVYDSGGTTVKDDGAGKEKAALDSSFETVDYVDIFGEASSCQENFVPAALSTQHRESSPPPKPRIVEEVGLPFPRKTAPPPTNPPPIQPEVSHCQVSAPAKRRKIDNAPGRPAKFSSPFLAGGPPQQRFVPGSGDTGAQLKFELGPVKRSLTVPETFQSCSEYQRTIIDLLYEHLNVSLSKIKTRYIELMTPAAKSRDTVPSCSHGPGRLNTVSKDGPNKGRKFYCCQMKACDLFKWSASGGSVDSSNPREVYDSFTRKGLSVYKGCKLGRKANSNRYLLHLPFTDKHHNYNKDDLWIISPESRTPSIMLSTFYGPNSEGRVELRLLNSHHPSTSATALQALRGVSELEIISTLASLPTLPLLPSLLNKSVACPPLEMACDPEEAASSLCREHGLNERQEEAILTALSSLQNGPAVVCVHGVFGSGKSFLLAVLVLALTRVLVEHHRILLTSTTNVAVDNVLLKLLALGYGDFARVGSARKIHRDIAPHTVKVESSKEEVGRALARYRVAGTTCASSAVTSNFDIVLLDEVSQITEPSSLLPLVSSACSRVLLVGDPLQLPPTLETEHVTKSGGGLEQTLFDRMQRLGYPTVTLNTQYRCHPDISAIANILFYNGQLQDGITRDSMEMPLGGVPAVSFVSVPGAESRSWGDSYSNTDECKAIISLVELVLKKVPQEEVAVITLYRGQEALLKKELGNKHRALKISTVDAVQGAERSVVLLSCVRSARIGFADCPKRTNVALTRAKHHLFMIGNLQMLSVNPLWGRIIQLCADKEQVFNLRDIIPMLQDD